MVDDGEFFEWFSYCVICCFDWGSVVGLIWVDVEGYEVVRIIVVVECWLWCIFEYEYGWFMLDCGIKIFDVGYYLVLRLWEE